MRTLASAKGLELLQPTLLCEERLLKGNASGLDCHCNPRSCARSDLTAWSSTDSLFYCNPRSCARSDHPLCEAR